MFQKYKHIFVYYVFCFLIANYLHWWTDDNDDDYDDDDMFAESLPELLRYTPLSNSVDCREKPLTSSSGWGQ